MILIGVDPGKNTGIAIWDREIRQFQGIYSTSPLGAIREIEGEVLKCKAEGREVEVHMEDSRLDKAVFQAINAAKTAMRYAKSKNSGVSAAASTGRKVGRVDTVCQMIEELCEELNVKLKHIRPSSRRRGIGTKVSSIKFKRITGYMKRTNEHGRDAAMIVYKK